MQKRNKTCPFCHIRRMFGAPKVDAPTFAPYDNDVRKTPLMGWSSWNTFRNRISQQLILETATAMKEKGLLDAGYCYVNLDDNWHSNMRDDNGEWQGDLVRFSEGIPALVDKVNALGFKVGLYSSNGTLTCEDLPASLGRELADARTLANGASNISSTISATTKKSANTHRLSIPSKYRSKARAWARKSKCPTPF